MSSSATLDITFLGHSGFLFVEGDHRVVIDPFLTGNPVAKHTPDDDLLKASYVLITHGHEDHYGPDAWAIANKHGATLIGGYEVAMHAKEVGKVENIEPGNPGGRIYTDFGHVAFVPALHSSSYQGQYMGVASGIVIYFKASNKTIYHTGDTGLFSDMKLIGELAKPDVMCVCAGDRFTMTPELAAMAVDMVNPKLAIPMHYATFPLLTDDLSGFKPKSAKVETMEVGATLSHDYLFSRG